MTAQHFSLTRLPAHATLAVNLMEVMMSSVPRNPDGTYAPHEATILEGNFFQIAIAKDKLRRVLEAPFGADGRIQGFTREDLDWALEVVRQRPGWAEQTLQAMGIRKEQG